MNLLSTDIERKLEFDFENYFMIKSQSLVGKMTPEFIDYCNLNGVDLVKWYRWQLHLIWEQRNINRRLSGNDKKQRSLR
jgi:uncharacterized protein YjaG (DUF416 family)